ncbi:retrovirus-related pol polyprotein from transposon TNT 1-94 [Tanacetum coccineum]
MSSSNFKKPFKPNREKARKRGKVFNWQTATYGKIRVDDDFYDLRSMEAEFPVIVVNDDFAPKDTLQCKSQVSIPIKDEIDFRISFDESDDEDYTIICDKISFSFKMISINNLKTDSETNYEKFTPSISSPEPAISCFNDLDFFKGFENELPAIVYNDAQTSKSYLLTEPILNPQHIDEFNLKDETSLFEYDEEEQNVICFNDLFPFNVIYPDELKTDTNNDNDKVDIEYSLEDLSVIPVPDVLNTNVGPHKRRIDDVGDVFTNLEILKPQDVPPSYTGNYMPSRPDLSFVGLDDSVYKTKVSETQTSTSKTSKDIVEKPKTVRPSAPIIKDYDIDSDNDSVFRPKSDQTKPNKKDFNQKSTAKTNNLNEKVKTARVNNVTTTGPKAVVSAAEGNGENVVKSSTCWIWRPTGNVIDHNSKGSGSYMLKRFDYVDLQCSLKIIEFLSGMLGIWNWNVRLFFRLSKSCGEFVAFGGSPKGGKINGKGKIRTGKLDFKDVYFVKELKFNLFSILQICDKKNSVLFTKTECLVPSPDFKLLDESQVLLKCDMNSTQNGVAERKNMTLIEVARTMLADSLLPTTFWAEVVSTACYVQNRVLVTKPHNKTPYELLHGSRPDWLFDIDLLTNSMNYEPVTAGNQTNKNAGIKYNVDAVPTQQYILLPLLYDSPQSSKDAVADDAGKKTNEETTNKGYTNNTNRVSTVSAAGEGFTNADNLPTDPLMPDLEDTTDLLNTSIFSGAYDDEDVGAETDLNNLETTMNFRPQKVWRLVDLPKCKHAIRTKWVYRNKKDKRGIVVRNKARLVAQGYTQEEEIDYDEIFALVAKIEAIRLFLAYVSFIGFIVYQIDVKSAFLYGTIEKEVYVCQPPGFEDPQFPDKVYKVEKALYGLHQAPKAWYEILSTYLLENGFRRGIIDKTLFIKKDKGDILLVQVYVDDIIFGSTKKDDGIFISQDKYMADILKKFDFVIVKTTSTLIETNKALLKDEEAEDVDVHLYRSMIESLMYLIAARPDIIYLKGQPKLGLWYPWDSPFDLEAFFDSDYAGASLDRKSTTGGCQFLSKILISWQCKKQTIVSNSTTEAEYVVAANCC